MFRWNSQALAALLVTLLSTDAVLGGVVPLQRAQFPSSDDTLLGQPKDSEIPASEAQQLKENESSLLKSVANDASDSEVKRKAKAVPPAPDFPDDDFFNDDLFDANKAREEEQQQTAMEAMGAVAFVAGTAMSFLTKPIISNLPPNVNKAIISFASFLNSVKNNKTEEYQSNSTSYIKGRQAREMPAYDMDGAVSTAVAWMKGENMDKMDSIAPSLKELAPFASLRGPDAARIGVVDPILTVIGVIRRAIATEFLTTAMVMTVAHLARLFFVNLPTLLPILGLPGASRRDLLAFDKPELVSESLAALGGIPEIENKLSENDASFFGPDRAKRAEVLAREVVAAVTRDQCAERAACLLGSHCSQYSFTPSLMRLMRSPEPDKDKPDHPVWLAFRDAAEGLSSIDDCDRMYKC